MNYIEVGYKENEIVGFRFGDKILCCECVTNKEANESTEDELVLLSNIWNDYKNPYICNRCKGRLHVAGYNHKLARIDIEKEYKLILQKKSRLSANMRKLVVKEFIIRDKKSLVDKRISE